MNRLLARDLEALRRARAALCFAAFWLGVSAVLAFHVGVLGETRGLPAFFSAALAAALLAAPVAVCVDRGMRLFGGVCPRCRERFFLRRRGGLALPSLQGRCGHCGLGLAAATEPAVELAPAAPPASAPTRRAPSP